MQAYAKRAMVAVSLTVAALALQARPKTLGTVIVSPVNQASMSNQERRQSVTAAKLENSRQIKVLP